MNNDISQILNSKASGTFYNKSYTGSTAELYGGLTGKNTLWGYIAPSSDIDIARGQYEVYIPELRTLAKCRLLIPPDKLGANGSGGALQRLEVHLPVLLLSLGNTGDYGILTSYVPLNAEQEDKLGNIVPDVKPINVRPTDSKLNTLITRHLPEAGVFINDVDTSKVVIDSPKDNLYSWSNLGNIITEGANGEKYEQLINTFTTSKTNVYEFVDGINYTKVDKTKAELFSFYQLTKYKLANTTKRLFEYSNGKIVPGPLLSQISKVSSNFTDEVTKYINKITDYLNQADVLIESISDFITWFDSSHTEKVSDLISLIGIPSRLSIGRVINIGINLTNANGIGIDINTGQRYIDSFLEGVANSLISDLLGDNSIIDVISSGLNSIGISLGGKSNPNNTQSINNLNPQIPPRREQKSLLEILDNITDIYGYPFKDVISLLRNNKQASTVNLVTNNTLSFSSNSSNYRMTIDYTNVNAKLDTAEGELSSIVTSYGVEFGAFIIQSLLDLQVTSNPLYILLAILPMVELKDKLWIILFTFYLTESTELKDYLIDLFIDDVPNSNKYLNNLRLVSIDYINTFLDELSIDRPDFEQLVLHPYEELSKYNFSSQINYYLQELLYGRVLNFIRGIIIVHSGYDITINLELYSRIRHLTRGLFYHATS